MVVLLFLVPEGKIYSESSLPDGLLVLEDYIDEEYEKTLLYLVKWEDDSSNASPGNTTPQAYYTEPYIEKVWSLKK